MVPLEQALPLQMLALAALPLLLVVLLALCLYPFRVSRCSREAEKSAEMLLRDLLSPEEQRGLAQLGYLVVRSPTVAEREYRIPAGGGYVYCYESSRPVMQICLQPAERLPLANVVLIHKLMIEGDEQAYLRQANIQWLSGGPARDRPAPADLVAPVADWREVPPL